MSTTHANFFSLMAEVAEVQFPHPLAAVEHHDGVCTG